MRKHIYSQYLNFMAINTLAEVKAYFKITTTSEDTLLESLLLQSEAGILSELWVETIAAAEVTEKHRVKSHCKPLREVMLYWLNPHGASVIINDLPLVEFAFYGRKLMFKDIVTPNSFWMIEVKYTAGYETIPWDLKLAQCLYINHLRTQINAKWMTEFRQGDLTVKYGWSSDSEIQYSALLASYKKVIICS